MWHVLCACRTQLQKVSNSLLHCMSGRLLHVRVVSEKPFCIITKGIFVYHSDSLFLTALLVGDFLRRLVAKIAGSSCTFNCTVLAWLFSLTRRFSRHSKYHLLKYQTKGEIIALNMQISDSTEETIRDSAKRKPIFRREQVFLRLE